MKKHQLIGTQVSLYTAKARCYLKYKGIEFEEVLSTGDVYKNVIIPRTGVRYIPVLITDDDVAIQDTTEIIDCLEKRYPEVSIYPTGPCQHLVALLFEVYGDEWLVNPAMYYRWHFPENREFAIQEFGRTSVPDASLEEQRLVGEKNSKPFAGALPRLGITEKNGKAIETSYLNFLKDFDQHLQHHAFLLGSRPSMGDFGLIGPLYAHLYRDPYSGRLMQEQAPHVFAWVQRMIDPEVCSGEFLENDQVPDTLFPLLARMFKEQGPVLMSTIDQVKIWSETHQEAQVPRALGSHAFCVEGVVEERRVFPFNQWMWQRPYDFFHELTGSDKTQVQALLDDVPAALTTLEYPITQRLLRKDNCLFLG